MAKKKSTTKKIENQKVDEKKTDEKKPKKSLKIFWIVATIVVVLGALGVVGYNFMMQPSETTTSISVSEDVRSFSGYFKEYVADRLEIENLVNYSFRTATNEEILAELTELKDGFSKISRGMNGFDEGSDYAEVATILKNDATVFLKMIRELRGVMTAEYAEEADRQVDFIKVVDENRKSLLSEVYLSRAAFSEETGNIGKNGILIFEGTMLAEVGGGVMNIFVGDIDEGVVAVTGGDYGGSVKRIDSKKLFGYTNSKLVLFGEGVLNEIEVLKLEQAKIEFETSSATVRRTYTPVNRKGTWNFQGEEAIPGLLKIEEKGTSELLLETANKIREKN